MELLLRLLQPCQLSEYSQETEVGQGIPNSQIFIIQQFARAEVHFQLALTWTLAFILFHPMTIQTKPIHLSTIRLVDTNASSSFDKRHNQNSYQPNM